MHERHTVYVSTECGYECRYVMDLHVYEAVIVSITAQVCVSVSTYTYMCLHDFLLSNSYFLVSLLVRLPLCFGCYVCHCSHRQSWRKR